MITANDLKTKGIACVEESLTDKTEDIITVRGKECYVVMKIEQYHYLREMELEAALHEARRDMASGQFSKDAVDQHVDDIFNK
ncbi:MAG: type II toxin-antitoxin system Phd/YefM family antitoxin [Proteobacteria bacterium]|nr:type II toxin-antitoxin system Phd/YefM family antitoxin [Pseudomonadota bacterium]